MRQISCRLERRIETVQFRRLAYGKRESNKRQPTIDLPPRLLAHIRRWHRLGISTKAVVEYHGAAVGRVTDGWDAVVEKAGLATDIPQDKVIPHTLRHTAISWYLRSGVPPHQVSLRCERADHQEGLQAPRSGRLRQPAGVIEPAGPRNSYATATDEMTRNRTRQDATKVKQNQSGDPLTSRFPRE